MIYKYEVIAPVPVSTEPYITNSEFLVIPNVNRSYQWYVTVSRYNPHSLDKDYFILFSTDKFDIQCRKTSTDNGGRFCVRVAGEVKDYITRELTSRSNIRVDYIESEDNVDVWQIV